MESKKISSFKIVKHHTYSWSYNYKTIDGKKRDISGSSLENLKKQVLDMGLPWDYENYPDEKISDSYYDDENLTSRLGAYSRIVDGDAIDRMESSTIAQGIRYAKSNKKR